MTPTLSKAARALAWARVIVRRFMCADQHRWAPEADYCRSCGITAQDLFDHRRLRSILGDEG